MKKKFLFTLIPLIMIVGLTLLSMTSYAFAPVVVQNNSHDQNSSTAVNVNFVSKVAKNDLLVYQIFANMTNGTGSVRISVEDNVSDILTRAVQLNSSFGTAYTYSAIYYTVATAKEAIRVEVNSSANIGLGLYIYEVSGITNVNVVSGSQASSGGCGCGFNTPLQVPANSFTVGGAVLNAPAGGTWTFSGVAWTGVPGTQQAAASEFFTYNLAYTATFVMIYSGTPVISSAMTGAAFYSGPATTTSTSTSSFATTITTWVEAPPAITQFQYWAFPLLFIVLPSAIFLAVGSVVRLDADAMILLFLFGTLIGSILGLFANIVPIGMVIFFMLPLLFFIWRGQGGSQ